MRTIVIPGHWKNFRATQTWRAVARDGHRGLKITSRSVVIATFPKNINIITPAGEHMGSKNESNPI